MNKVLLAVAMVTVIAVAGMAEASIYNNTISENPFSLSLDTGTSDWRNVITSLNSASTTRIWESTSTSTSSPVTKIVNPLPGLKGTFDIYTETINNTYAYKQNYQKFNIDYSGGLSAPSVGSNTYTLSGEIAKKNGETLLSYGESLNFNMGMNVNFTDLYTSNTASGNLTFKIGNSQGNWIYEYNAPFNTSSGSISLADSLHALDLNNANYFEADYTIIGNSGIQYNASNLNLNIFGTLYGPQESKLIKTTPPTQTSLYHSDIPALPLPPAAVPIPAAAWLLSSGLVGLVGLRRKLQLQI